MSLARTIRRLFSARLRNQKNRQRTQRNRTLAWLEGLEQRTVMSSTPVGYLIQGNAGSYQVPLNGASSFTAASVTQGTLPTGLSLSSAGVISGTPAAGTNGNYSLTLSVTPSGGSATSEDVTLTVLANQFVDPNYSASDGFGSSIVVLSGGNVVVTAPQDDAGGTDAGAVYLFNGSTGALISTLTGSTANDKVGIDGVTALSNGNYVVKSTSWSSAMGAVTWGNGTTGVSGTVSSANSLVGSTANDKAGNLGVTPLNNGNYVVTSSSWANGTVASVGAVTWGSGTVGVKGVISSSNSLIGSTANDKLGMFGTSLRNGVTALSNGNYVVTSTNWNNGTATLAGAVTWGSGTAGVMGAASSVNSLVGSTANDKIGFISNGTNGVTALSNGNYVVSSANWDNGTISNVGAVTWGSGTAGITGVITSSNSLIGALANDSVGSNGASAPITALSNGNYVVTSSSWHSGTISSVGAVTWGSGTAGVKGVVSSSNSLVGSSANDKVGLISTSILGLTALSNGNYVVISPAWHNGTVSNAGAVTWSSGTAGITGVISSSNSLVGSTLNDNVGQIINNTQFYNGVTALSNGNYVVASNYWNNGTVTQVGAVTWSSGTAGVKGVISSANSLIGSAYQDWVGYSSSGGVTALSNGNYVVVSYRWDNGTVANAGAVRGAAAPPALRA